MTQQADQETLGQVLLGEYNDEQLVGIYAAAQQEAVEAQDRAGRLEQELQRRAAERGATVIRGDGMNYVITIKNEYDRSKLPPVLELFDPEGKTKSFTPAHMEEVLIPEKWDLQQVNKYAKQAGNDALDIVDTATFPGKVTGKLVIQ